jgi:hypothetical protein
VSDDVADGFQLGDGGTYCVASFGAMESDPVGVDAPIVGHRQQ